MAHGGANMNIGLPIPLPRDQGTWGYLGWVYNNVASSIDDVAKVPWLLDMGQAILKGLQSLVSAPAIVNLGPLRTLIGAHLNSALVTQWAQAAPGRALRLAMVSLDSGVLRYMTETGALVEKDLHTPVLAPAAPPNCSALESQLAALQATRQDMIKANTQAGIKPSKDLELRRIALEIQDMQAELNACRAKPAGPPAPVHASLIDGIIASSSQPGIMPAVKIGGETYVDGGIRQILPLQAAIDLGATTVWAIQASPAGVSKSGPYSNATGFTVAARAITEIVFDEVAAANEIAGAGRDVKFIRPAVTVHDPFAVDPGLMKISLDYGYMRAADVFHSADAATIDLADRITTARRDIWQLETAVAIVPPMPTLISMAITLAQIAMREIRSRKCALHRLVEARTLRGGVVPAGLAEQWLAWERHALPIESASPWGRITIMGSPAMPPADPCGDSHVPEWSWLNMGKPQGANIRGLMGAVTVMDTPTSPQRPHVFVEGNDFNLWCRYSNGADWAWTNMGKPQGANIIGLVGAVTVRDTPTSPQRAHVFVAGNDGNLWCRYSNGADWAWTNMGKPQGANIRGLMGAVTVMDTPTSPQRPHVFVEGNDFNLWCRYSNGADWAWTNMGKPQGANIIGLVGAVTVRDTPTSPQRAHVFVAGNDGNLWCRYSNGADWAWTNMGKPQGANIRGLMGAVTVMDTPTSPQRPHVFVEGNDFNLWCRYSNGADWAWTNMGKPQGANIIGLVGAVTVRDTPTSPQRAHVFVAGNDGNLWCRYSNGADWAWTNMGKPQGANIRGLMGAVTVMDTPTSPQRPHVFVEGNDFNLWGRLVGINFLFLRVFRR